MVEVFAGRTLVNKHGDQVEPEEALRNKVVGIYFSAGWCPPCRDFTPILSDFYTELVEGGDPPAQFEIVFVSSDKRPEEMREYYRELHGDWLALPWADGFKKWVESSALRGAGWLRNIHSKQRTSWAYLCFIQLEFKRAQGWLCKMLTGVTFPGIRVRREDFYFKSAFAES